MFSKEYLGFHTYLIRDFGGFCLGFLGRRGLSRFFVQVGFVREGLGPDTPEPVNILNH